MLLEKVKPSFHLGALAPAHGWQREAESSVGRDGATGKLLVLAAPVVPPKTEDVGDPREGS